MRHILLSCAILLLALSFCLFSMLHIRENLQASTLRAHKRAGAGANI